MFVLVLATCRIFSSFLDVPHRWSIQKWDFISSQDFWKSTSRQHIDINWNNILIIGCTSYERLKEFWHAKVTNMGVSKNKGTPKSSIFHRVFHYKPSILGYHHFRKHPYQALLLKNVEATKLEKAKSWAMWFSLRGASTQVDFFFVKVMGKHHQR